MTPTPSHPPPCLIGLCKQKSESESRSVVTDSLWPRGQYSPWNFPGQNTGVQGILPIQGSNPGILYCRWILYQLSHHGSPRILEWVAYPFCRGSSQPWNWTWVSCTADRFFTIWAARESQQCGRPRFNPWVRKIPLEKKMATHSSILAWRIPWTEEPGGLQSMES